MTVMMARAFNEAGIASGKGTYPAKRASECCLAQLRVTLWVADRLLHLLFSVHRFLCHVLLAADEDAERGCD